MPAGVDGDARGCAGPRASSRARDDARGPGHPRASPSTPAGIHRRAGCPVRVLHQRHDHDSRGAAEAESEAERLRAPLGARRKPLPLRHPPEDPARDPTGRPGMTPTIALASSRREFLKSAGAVIVAFAWPTPLSAQAPRDVTPGGLDAWLAIAADGAVTLFTGKVEIGTGVSTALAQIVAEELDVRVERVGVIQGDTERTPNQGYTAGSKTIQQGGPPIRQAAAEARRTLLGLAAARLGVTPEQLTVDDGVVALRGDAAQRVMYAELIGGRRFERAVSAPATTKRPSEYRVVGTSVARVDIPGKVTGAPSYVHDLRLPGMLHARVVRPPAVGATVESIDESSVRDVPGHVRVVREGNFIGVVAEREEQAIRAGQALTLAWKESPRLPEMTELYREMRAAHTTDKTLSSRGDAAAAFAATARTVSATYEWPLQMHASMGPSCSVAH